MATTTKITLSVDSVALSLAQRAAELDGVSVSAMVSRILRRHILTDYGPASGGPYTGADRQRDEDQSVASRPAPRARSAEERKRRGSTFIAPAGPSWAALPDRVTVTIRPPA